MTEDTASLWREFGRSRDRTLRERLILAYTPLAAFVARRLGAHLPPHVDEGDVVASGLVGLIGAIDRFDVTRETAFEPYAVARIRGAIVDELRALDWVPRSVRASAREIEQALVELERELHRAPTDEELASRLGLETEELGRRLLEISRSSLAALDAPWHAAPDDGEVTLLETLEDVRVAESAAERERRASIAAAIAGLPDRERRLIALYYYAELTLREIGELLGVTESRVSQLHAQAILRLNARLGA